MSSQKTDSQMSVFYLKKWLSLVKPEKKDLTKYNSKPSKLFSSGAQISLFLLFKFHVKNFQTPVKVDAMKLSTVL